MLFLARMHIREKKGDLQETVEISPLLGGSKSHPPHTMEKPSGLRPGDVERWMMLTLQKASISRIPETEASLTFPIEGKINRYGFLRLSAKLAAYMGLPLATEDQKGVLADDVKVEISGFDGENKVLFVKLA